MSANHCTTHHHACDCREAKFEALEAERDKLREAAQAVVDNPSAVNLSVLALALEADDE